MLLLCVFRGPSNVSKQSIEETSNMHELQLVLLVRTHTRLPTSSFALRNVHVHAHAVLPR